MTKLDVRWRVVLRNVWETITHYGDEHTTRSAAVEDQGRYIAEMPVRAKLTTELQMRVGDSRYWIADASTWGSNDTQSGT